MLISRCDKLEKIQNIDSKGEYYFMINEKTHFKTTLRFSCNLLGTNYDSYELNT